MGKPKMQYPSFAENYNLETVQQVICFFTSIGGEVKFSANHADKKVITTTITVTLTNGDEIKYVGPGKVMVNASAKWAADGFLRRLDSYKLEDLDKIDILLGLGL